MYTFFIILKGLPNRRIQAIMNKRPAPIRAFKATTMSLNVESTQSGTTGRVILIHHLQNIFDLLFLDVIKLTLIFFKNITVYKKDKLKEQLKMYGLLDLYDIFKRQRITHTVLWKLEHEHLLEMDLKIGQRIRYLEAKQKYMEKLPTTGNPINYICND